jgi:hypothetical protein
MTPEQVKDFRHAYNCILRESNQQYAKPITRAFVADPSVAPATFEVEYQSGIDVTFMKDQFHQMIEDAEEGRERKHIRDWHPAVREAYEHYQQLLYLTRMNK